MVTGQAGIFALGDTEHGFFEFARVQGTPARDLIAAFAGLRAPQTTVGGMNLVVGFRPSLWREAAPGGIGADVHDFDAPLRGPDGFTMPATQADAWIWLSGASYDLIFDAGTAIVDGIAPVARLLRETKGWSYRHSRDLTGFEDGTENPTLFEAPQIALVPDGAPGAGGSVLLFQQWVHDAHAFHALSESRQEDVIGRTKPGSVELEGDLQPPDSHVSRTTLVVDGVELDIFRRNVPYGIVSNHGTMFVGFSCEQRRLHGMLEQMVGIGGPRDALTRYTTPLTGAYYFLPSVQALSTFAGAGEDNPPVVPVSSKEPPRN